MLNAPLRSSPDSNGVSGKGALETARSEAGLGIPRKNIKSMMASAAGLLHARRRRLVDRPRRVAERQESTSGGGKSLGISDARVSGGPSEQDERGHLEADRRAHHGQLEEPAERRHRRNDVERPGDD